MAAEAAAEPTTRPVLAVAPVEELAGWECASHQFRGLGFRPRRIKKGTHAFPLATAVSGGQVSGLSGNRFRLNRNVWPVSSGLSGIFLLSG